MIILSLPFHREHSADFLLALGQSRKSNVDRKIYQAIELRLDFYDKLSDAKSLLSHICNTVKQYKLCDNIEEIIFNIRYAQYNAINIDYIKYKYYIYECILQKFRALVDISVEEIFILKPQIKPQNLIISYHEEDSSKFSVDNVSLFLSKYGSIPCKFLKLALEVNSYESLLKLNEQFELTDSRKILFAGQGLLGKLTRLVHDRIEAMGTYIGLAGYQTSEHQPSFAEMLLMSSRSNRRKQAVSGIIGGKQVYKSLGLYYYNKYFADKRINSVYLPFPLEDKDDFKNLTLFISKKSVLIGFSVTMPHKSMFSSFNHYNLFISRNDISKEDKFFLFNTDEQAIIKSLEHVNACKDSRILIFGSGATAEMFIQKAPDGSKLTILSRNTDRTDYLIEKYNCLRYGGEKDIDIFINCTPLGSSGEDLIGLTGITKFHAAIDLAYNKSDFFIDNNNNISFSVINTGLVSYCLRERKKFVDGHQFWIWQSSGQKVEFLKKLNIDIAD